MKTKTCLFAVWIVGALLFAFGCALFNASPVAQFTADLLSGISPLTVHFDAGGSDDPDGTIVLYEWTFGDGATATGVTVDHQFTAILPTTYTVTLTVTDEEGASDESSQTIEVLGASAPGNDPPTAHLVASPTWGYTPLSVTFDASLSSDSDGTIIQYGWDFGDDATGSGESLSYIYATNVTRDYTVTLTVTDNEGGTGTATAVITVLVMPDVTGDRPTADFEFSEPVLVYDSPSLPSVPSLFEVEFDPNASAAAPGHDLENFIWEFGDGTSETRSTDATITHQYACVASACTFVVKLTVVDDQGLTDSVLKNVTVINQGG